MNRNDPRLLAMAEQNKAANKLILELKKSPGVLYALKVGDLKPQTTAVNLTFDTQKNLDSFSLDKTLRQISSEETNAWRSFHKDESLPIAYTIKDITVFVKLISPLHSDLVKEKDHYLLQVREYLGNEDQVPYWKTWHTVEHSPNKQYDREHPPEALAKKLGEGWMQAVFVEEDEEEENEGGDKNYVRPRPIKAEYRIIKVVTTQEVIDYQLRSPDDPFTCVKCQKASRIGDLLQRRLPETLGYSLVCKTCDTEVSPVID